MQFAPIALFAYNRLTHIRQTIEALQKNEYADATELYIFSDGPKSVLNMDKVDAVRDYLKTVRGFKTVTCIERKENLGLATSIIAGVTEIVNRFGRIIVLEDDMVTSPHFLKFMNDALDFYSSEERVISIHSYIYPVNAILPETFFLRGADCWGWATWKRGWDLFEPDGKLLLSGLRTGDRSKRFDYDGSYGYTKMLEDQVNGKNDSWAIRWNASAFLTDKLTLYPGRSLVRNTGLDSSGTHCGNTLTYDARISSVPVSVSAIPVEENIQARQAFKDFFQSTRPSLMRKAINLFNRKRAGIT